MDNIPSGLISIALGVAVLLLGKNLRLFAAAAGFLIGLSVMNLLFPGGSVLTAAIVAVILAIVAVVLLAVARGGVRLVLRIIGAIAGAAIALWLLESLGVNLGLVNWIIALAGALTGFGLMARFFNLGIIILTSLLGASLIIGGVEKFVPLGDGVTTLLTLALAVVGILFQRSR